MPHLTNDPGLHQRYLATPRHPIRDVLRQMTGVAPPKFVQGYSFTGLTDMQHMQLQDWAATHAKPHWLTGIGLIEAAERQVEEAVTNGNIPPADHAPADVRPAPARKTRRRARR